MVITLTFSCGLHQYRLNNEDAIKKIDEESIDEIILEFSGQDTLSKKKRKYTEKGDKMYEETSYVNNSISKNYYRQNGELFYSLINFQNTNNSSKYQTYLNSQGLIENAEMINFENDEAVDTILLNYNYKFRETTGLKEKLEIVSSSRDLKHITVVQYNLHENPTFQVEILNQDTISIKEYHYRANKSLEKILTTNLKKKMQNSTLFNAMENIEQDYLFKMKNDSLVLLKKSEYQYNINNKLESKEINENGNKTILKYMYF